jgi:hypothetical protein
MQQVAIHRAAEAPDHKSGHDQRHAEVEVRAQEPLELLRRACISCMRNRNGRASGGHRSLLSEPGLPRTQFECQEQRLVPILLRAQQIGFGSPPSIQRLVLGSAICCA